MSTIHTVIVVGGDGFCGWPLSLRLSKLGYNVVIVDNLSRRRIDNELGSSSLVPISSIYDRIRAWKEATGKTIYFELIDVATNPLAFTKCVEQYAPQTVVQLGEQRSAPYSMRSSECAQYTVRNNLCCTHTILTCMKSNPFHLVHLGTMGVYGYGTIKDSVLPEGYIDVEMDGKTVNILHPAYPGSIYHMTKAQDALMFQFYAKNYGARITDLHQGIVWGTQTEDTMIDKRLSNRVDYDETYGTVLNRFIVQGIHKHPLTIYGTGEQTRAFIHIQNSVECMVLAVQHPPSPGFKPLIMNQMTQCLQVKDIADIVIAALGADGSTMFCDNPRKELVSNSLYVKNDRLLALGLNKSTIMLDENQVRQIIDEFKQYTCTFSASNVMPSSKW